MNFESFQLFYTMINYKIVIFFEDDKYQLKLSPLRNWGKYLRIKTYIHDYYLKNKRVQE